LEDRLRRLEEIVRSLESNDLELDGALALFEEGVEHVRSAEDTLKNAELRVEELLGPLEELTTQPLEDEEDES
jgi:exodeoxyribonuclease VII small subunit